MSLFAHIVSQNLVPEPTATQSLAYILRSSSELAASLADLLWPDVGFEVGHVESERSFADVRPDLTIFDSDGRHRIFVENKFWAGLTDAQPVQYLAALPDDVPSGLVFIVPMKRIPAIWNELKWRSRDSLDLGNESSSDNVTRLQLGTRTLCATSWRHVLDLLERVCPSDEQRRDVSQLRELARFGEADGFPPLRGEELSDVRIPSRTINYCRLVRPIVSELQSRGVARTKGLRPTHDWYHIGRYFSASHAFGCWLGVALVPWRDTGITPLWLRVHPTPFSNLGEHYHRLDESFRDIQERGNAKYLPIRLRTGVERDDVIRDAADQVQDIVRKFEEITGKGSPDKPA